MHNFRTIRNSNYELSNSKIERGQYETEIEVDSRLIRNMHSVDRLFNFKSFLDKNFWPNYCIVLVREFALTFEGKFLMSLKQYPLNLTFNAYWCLSLVYITQILRRISCSLLFVLFISKKHCDFFVIKVDVSYIKQL